MVKMSATVQEALKSDDPELIRKTRAAFKSKLTRAANNLIAEVKTDGSGKFLFQEVNKEEVDSLFSNLQVVKEVVEEMHVHYTVKRVHKEGQEEVKLKALDDDYASGI